MEGGAAAIDQGAMHTEKEDPEQRSSRKARTSVAKGVREPGTIFTNFTLVQDLHADLLFKDLLKALMDQDCRKISSLVPVLMVALASGAKPDGKRKRKAEFRTVIMAGLEVLRRHPKQCSNERLRKYLRTAQAYEKRPAYMAGLGMELALAFLEAGEAEQAHSLMFSDKDAQLDLGTRFRVRAAAGQLRYQQWLHAWLSAERRDPNTQVPDAMGFDEAVWARSNRQAQEYWKEAESALREAVDLQPAATEIAYLLIHLLIFAGRIQQAMDVAVKLREEAMEDADAHALSILMLQASHETPESLERLVQAHVDLLMVHPASRQAIDGFMNLCQQTDKVSLAKQALCICLHLDVAGGDPASGPLWINLADALYVAALKLVESHDDPEEDTFLDASQRWSEISGVICPRKYWSVMHFSFGQHSMSGSGTAEEEEMLAAKAVCAAFIADDGCQYCSHIAKQLLKSGNQEAHDSIQQAISVSTQLLAMHAPSRATQGGLAAYGKHSLQYGTVVQLPKSWWKAFPPYRRKQ